MLRNRGGGLRSGWGNRLNSIRSRVDVVLMEP